MLQMHKQCAVLIQEQGINFHNKRLLSILMRLFSSLFSYRLVLQRCQTTVYKKASVKAVHNKSSHKKMDCSYFNCLFTLQNSTYVNDFAVFMYVYVKYAKTFLIMSFCFQHRTSL